MFYVFDLFNVELIEHISERWCNSSIRGLGIFVLTVVLPHAEISRQVTWISNSGLGCHIPDPVSLSCIPYSGFEINFLISVFEVSFKSRYHVASANSLSSFYYSLFLKW